MLYLTLITCLFIMFFQPAAVFPWLQGYRPLRTSAIISLLCYFFSNDSVNRQSFWSIAENRLFTYFIVWQVLSASSIWLHGGINLAESWLKMWIVYFLITKCVSSELRLRGVLWSIIFAIAYLSYFSISAYLKEYSSYGVAFARGFGWYDGKNDLANILVSVIPLCFYLFLKNKNTLIKIFLTALISIYSLNLALTGSRAGLLGFIAAFSFSVYRFFSIGRVVKILVMATAISLIGVIGYTTITSRSDISSNNLTGDSSAEDRIQQWKAGMRMLKAHPIFGVGPGEFRFESRHYGGMPGLQPHNTFVKMFAESGLMGGLLFISLVWKPLSYIFKLRSIDMSEMPLIYLGITTLGFSVCAFFQNSDNAYILYVILALFVAAKQWTVIENHESNA